MGLCRNHCSPKLNSAFARQTFHQIAQRPGETVQQFATRLRSAARDCEYGNDVENQMRDAVLNKCESLYVKRKLLEEGQGLTLARTLQIAQQCESVESQMAAMRLKNEPSPSEQVNRVARDNTSGERQPTKGGCYRCGKTGHFARDPQCPAKGKSCRNCGGKHHFENVCRSQKRSVNLVNDDAARNDSDYAFCLGGTEDDSNMLRVDVGNVTLKMLVDSGATSNIVDEATWEKLKLKKVKCESRVAVGGKKLYAYASDTPLQVKGSFVCTVSAGTRSEEAEFLVVQGRGVPLLGRKTATQLGVLKIGVGVAAVSDVASTLKLDYPEVFNGIGKLNSSKITLHIDPDVKPVAQPLRRIPFNLRSKVDDKINELIAHDIIEEVDGPTPWVNPVVIVPKSNSSDIRLCIDMRRANEAIIRGRYPIPTVDELLQNMNGSKVFSKIDLKWGYHQLELTEESRDITTFATHSGLYRYKRLLFGVSSASEQYQHEIAAALAGIEGVENISDDIVIHAPDEETHNERLHAVMQRLSRCGLTVNGAKCQFNLERLVFMGILLSQKGIGPTKDRVKAVVKAREPENASEVRSFLGMVCYSSRFIPQFSSISEPLRRLTKKHEPFVFGDEQKRAFKLLKDSIAEAITLAYFDKNAPTQVIADAGPVGLGAVLVQKQGDSLVPVCYASRGLTTCEQRYSQTEKEALALVWACERLHAYVYGMRFDLVTDHKPLEAIYSPRSRPCARVERWMLRLQPYDFRVVHIPGPQNIADPLSRLVKGECRDTANEADDYVRFVAVSATPKAMSTREVEEALGNDEELQNVRDAIQTGNFVKCRAYMAIASELCVVGQLVLRGTRIVLPVKLRPAALALAHEGHLGIVGTKTMLRSKVWWPAMDREAERHCRSCYGCQLVARPDPPEPLSPTPLPDGPWVDVATDLMGPLPSGHSLLVVVDYFTRYYEVAVLKSTTADKVIDSLNEAFSRHGLPVTVKSDNGPQFRSSEFAEYCTENNITHLRVTAKWAQANGEVERQNASLLKRIRIAQAERKDWKRELRKYLAQYRNLPHTTTGRTPAELLYNRKLRGKLPDIGSNPVVDHELRDRDSEMKGRSKIYADERRGARYSEIETGDRVLVQQEKTNKLSTPFSPNPLTVVSKTGNSLVIEAEDGARYSRNTSHVRKFLEPDSENVHDDQASVMEAPTPQASTAVASSTEHPSTPMKQVLPPRCQRERRIPKRFEDFVCE